MPNPDEPTPAATPRDQPRAKPAAASHATGHGAASATLRTEPIAFIGGGTMARAIIGGAIEAGAVLPQRLVVVDPKPDRRDVFTRLGVHACPTIDGAIETLRRIESSAGAGQILLAIKPQSLGSVADELAPLLEGERRVVISILAGVRSERIASLLGGGGVTVGGDGGDGGDGGAGVGVIRVMPNTPAQIGMGMTAIAMGAGTAAGDDALSQAVFAAVGEVISIDENLMDAFTAIAGSGPAYVFYLAEAMSAAGVRLGFSHEEADRIVRQTIAGAANLMADSGNGPTPGPAALRAAVTSKNGTTHAATTRMDELGVMDAIITAVRAARDRGRELARG